MKYNQLFVVEGILQDGMLCWKAQYVNYKANEVFLFPNF